MLPVQHIFVMNVNIWVPMATVSKDQRTTLQTRIAHYNSQYGHIDYRIILRKRDGMRQLCNLGDVQGRALTTLCVYVCHVFFTAIYYTYHIICFFRIEDLFLLFRQHLQLKVRVELPLVSCVHGTKQYLVQHQNKTGIR